MYAQAISGSEPDMEAESAKLGDNAMIAFKLLHCLQISSFLKMRSQQLNACAKRHEGIIALESIMEAMKDGSFANNTQATAGASEQQLREMMNDPRYWKERDPHYYQ